jgi:hypothetical protein
MRAASPYFDQAADVLNRAMTASGIGEQERLLEEALRLNRLALRDQRRKRARTAASTLNKPK